MEATKDSEVLTKVLNLQDQITLLAKTQESFEMRILQNILEKEAKFEEFKSSIQKEMVEFKAANQRSEVLVPLLMFSIKCKDELIQRLITEMSEERAHNKGNVAQLNLKMHDNFKY